MNKRVCQIDFLKCVFIVLMIMFHLVYVGDKYPYAKQVVYTFHMSVFLVISGYLANMDKGFTRMVRQVKWLFVPYAVMEAGYVVMASVLPIREHIDNLTLAVFFDKLLLHPLGPYWYLHTLIVCYIIYYAVSRLCRHLGWVSFVCVLGVCLFAVSRLLHVVNFDNAMYFLAGAALRQAGVGFMSAFRPSWWAAVPLALFCLSSPEGMDRAALQGVVMTYLAMSLALAAYPYIRPKAKRLALMVGENTLSILLFSPMFTIITKSFVPFFSFDPTALLFTVVSVMFVVAGSLAVALAMDRLRLSRWFCGKERLFAVP